MSKEKSDLQKLGVHSSILEMPESEFIKMQAKIHAEKD